MLKIDRRKVGPLLGPVILKSNHVLLITLEFRHHPVFNSIHFAIYTWLPNCAKFEKNPITGYMCKNKGNFMLCLHPP